MPQTDEQKKLVSEFFAKRGAVAAIVPEKAELGDINQIFEVMSETYSGSKKNENKAGYIMAAHMLHAQNNPSLWSGKFKKFKMFCEAKVFRNGFERASAFKYKKVVECWPHAAFQDLAKIPLVNMLLISKVTREGEPSAEKDFEAAKTLDYKELLAHVEKVHGTSRDSVTNTVAKIPGTVEQVRDIQRFLKNTRVHEIVETDNPAAIILACIAEFAGQHGIGDDSKAESAA